MRHQCFPHGSPTILWFGFNFQVNTEQPFKVVTRFHAPAGVFDSIEHLNGINMEDGVTVSLAMSVHAISSGFQ
jgi:hypothetical protein